MNWFPIETAPQDGRRVLLWAEGFPYPLTCWWKRGKWVTDDHLNPKKSEAPILWSPLMAPSRTDA